MKNSWVGPCVRVHVYMYTLTWNLTMYTYSLCNHKRRAIHGSLNMIQMYIPYMHMYIVHVHAVRIIVVHVHVTLRKMYMWSCYSYALSLTKFRPHLFAAFGHVWSLTDIVRRVARCAEALTFDLFGKAKVSEFQFGSTSEISVEQVLWLWNKA